MAINKKLITFDKKSTFLGANGINNVSSPTDGYYHNIPEWSMVFILETGEIWHNGKYFGRPIKDQIFPATSQLTKGIVFMNNDDYYYRSFNLWGNVFDGSVRDINGELVVQGETYKWTYGDGVIRKGNANLIAFSGLSGVYDVFIPSGNLSVTGGDLKVGNNITLASTGSIKGTHILNTNSYFNLDYSLGKTWNSIKLFNTSGTLISLDSTRPAIINIQAGVYASGTNWQPWITGGDVTELSSWGIGLGGDAFYIGRISKSNTENSLSQYWKFDSEDGITISGTTKYIKVADLAGASEKIFMADGTVKALSDIASESLIGEATTTNYGGFKLTQNKSSVQQTLVSNTTGNGRYAVKMNADGTLFVEFVLANTWLPATNTQGGYVPQLSGSNDAISSSLNDYVLTFTSSDTETITPTWRRLPSNAFDNTWRGIYVDNISKLGTGITTKPINFKAGSGITLTFTAAGDNAYNTLQIDGTTYSTATDSTLGLVKVGTTLDDVTGFTAIHIKDGKIYYKDTTYSFSNLKFQLTSGTDLMTYNSLSAKTILAGTGITFSYLDNVLTISSAIYSTATNSILGLVKVGTTLEDTTGYTKVHIDDSGFIYYHDTTCSFSKLKFQQTSGTDLMTYDSQAARTILAGDNITFTHSNNILTIKATDTTYNAATSSVLGLIKIGTTLDDASGYTKVHIKDGFAYYHDTTYSFSKLKFLLTSGTDLMTYDSLAARTIVAGDNITFTHSNNVLTIKATDTTYSTASNSALGLVKTGAAVTDTTGMTAVHIKDGVIYYKDTNTTYSTASNTNLGLVKTGAAINDATGYTACHIKDGIIYYKDTNTTYSTATSSALGLVKVGNTINDTTGYTAVHINDGKIYYKDTNTTYSTATSSTLGLVKVGDTINDTTGYTAVHINNGKIYYKDTNTTYSTATSSALGLVKTGSAITDTTGYTKVAIKDGVIYYKDTNTTYSTATSSVLGLIKVGDTLTDTTGYTKVAIKDGIAYYKDTNTTYSTATSSALGLVKVGDTISDATDYTACKIKDGVIYYKDTNTTYSFYNLQFQNSGGTTVDTYKPTTSPTKTLKAGSNVTISAASNVITIASTNTWNANAVGVAGYVAAPTKAANANMTWLTDANGNPAWRASNNHSHNYLPLSGGTLTGTLKIYYSGADFTKANNDVSENKYPGFFICDKNGKQTGRVFTTVNPNGKLTTYLYSTNYNTEGSSVGEMYIGQEISKDGTKKWVLTDAASFRTALGLGSNATSSTAYLPLAGNTMNDKAVIARSCTSANVSWYQGRLYPIIKTTSYTGYNSILSMKTTNGSWDLGVYSNDTAYLTYIKDEHYNAGSNTRTYQLTFPLKSDTLAVLGDIPTNYYSSTQSRTANYVLAAPNGSNGVASFRKLVAADIPSLSYVKLDASTSEQTVKSSISSASHGVLTLWRNSGNHIAFLGFSNGTTETYLGAIGFKSNSDTNLYHRTPSAVCYKIWDSGNFTPSDYLPLTGGKLTSSTSDTPLTLQSNATSSWLSFRDSNNNHLGSYGVNSSKSPVFYNGSTYTIWHSGNDDGLFTGFVADGTSTKITIGGTSKSLTIPYATEANRLLAAQILSTNTSGDANTMQLDSDGTVYSVLTNYNSNPKWQNMPTFGTDSYGGVVEIKGKDSSLKMQFAWAAFHGNTTAPTEGLWYRARANKGYLASDWRKVAFTDSDITGNAATATKLKNTRKLWGNDFSGTANVGGNITLDAGDGSRQVKITKNGSFQVFASTGGMAGGLSAMTNDGSTTLGMFGYLCSGDTLTRLYIGTSYSSPWVSFLSDGNVGIGTTDPSEKLEVSGNIKATNLLITKINGVTVGNSPKFTDTTYSTFVKSGSTAAAGLVPKPPTTAGTTKYLCENGTWAVPTDTNTDTKVTSTKTEPASGTTWYALCTTSSDTATGSAVKSPSVRFLVLYGTTETAGRSRLDLGNATAVGTAGNMTGSILMYGSTGKYAHIVPHTGDTDNRTIYTPKSTGTLVVHTTDTAVGSSTQPVYISAAGVATAIGHTIAADVPSGAKFTDTTYSAGTLALYNTGTDTANRVWSANVLKSIGNKYLPLTGGTMTGNVTFNSGDTTEKCIDFVSNRAGGTGGWAFEQIRVKDKDNNILYQIGVLGSASTLTYSYIGTGNYNSANNLRIYPTYPAWGANKIWHAGNDGADSGLDADLLDGQHGNYYAKEDYFYSGGVAKNAKHLPKGYGYDGGEGITNPYHLMAEATVSGTGARNITGVFLVSSFYNHSRGILFVQGRIDGSGTTINTTNTHARWITKDSDLNVNNFILTAKATSDSLTCKLYYKVTGAWDHARITLLDDSLWASTANTWVLHSSATNTAGNYVFKTIPSGETQFVSVDVTTSKYASQFSTSRTLWGQSFNGTANVSGNMSSVGTISASGNNTITKSSTDETKFIAKNNNGTVELLTSTNRGVYDRTKTRWIITTDGTNSWLSAGNVGIGTTTPTEKLHVSGNAKATKFIGALEGNADTATILKTARTLWGKSFDGSANISGNMTSVGNITFTNNARIHQPDVSGNILYIGNASNNGWVMLADACSQSGNTYWRLIADGTANFVKVGINMGATDPSYPLHVSGNVGASNFYTTSDRSKKQNISSFSEHIRKFQLKDTEKWHYGVIAQEVEEMFRDGKEGSMTVNYNSVLSYYVGQLENRVKELEDRLKKYEDKVKKC